MNSDSNWSDKNEAKICGVLTRDAELKYTPNGTPVCNLNLVTKYKQFSEFHNIVAWKEQAESCAMLKKGDRIKVFGSLKTESWEADGKKHYRTKITALNISAEGRDIKAPEKKMTNIVTSTSGAQIGDEDIPF